MRIVALEEHFMIPELGGKIDRAAIARRGFPPPDKMPAGMPGPERLADVGEGRIKDMDRSGITVQVLSSGLIGADLLEPAEGIAWARAFNERTAHIVAEHPDRYAAFAHLPVTAPEAAADELERAVRDSHFCGAMINGMTQDKFLDDPAFTPILARAAQLDVPIYIHPNLPPTAVQKAYYDNLPGGLGFACATAGWGWHQEVALHVLRLALSGALDRHRKLKIIIGHMGEGLPAMLARCDAILGPEASKYLERPVSQTILNHVTITTAGFFTLPPFMAALLTFGVDRIMFSVDYPYSENASGRAFLDQLPVNAEDKAKIAHGNADRILKLSQR